LTAALQLTIAGKVSQSTVAIVVRPFVLDQTKTANRMSRANPVLAIQLRRGAIVFAVVKLLRKPMKFSP
jgi:hypothetical protein